MYLSNKWEKIGTTDVDLSGYLKKTDIAAWAKAATKPTYTAAEVGAISNTAPAAAITSADISHWNESEVFTVTASITGQDEETGNFIVSANKTYMEITVAIAAHKKVQAVLNYGDGVDTSVRRFVIPCTGTAETVVNFEGFVPSPSEVVDYTVVE